MRERDTFVFFVISDIDIMGSFEYTLVCLRHNALRKPKSITPISSSVKAA